MGSGRSVPLFCILNVTYLVFLLTRMLLNKKKIKNSNDWGCWLWGVGPMLTRCSVSWCQSEPEFILVKLLLWSGRKMRSRRLKPHSHSDSCNSRRLTICLVERPEQCCQCYSVITFKLETSSFFHYLTALSLSFAWYLLKQSLHLLSPRGHSYMI